MHVVVEELKSWNWESDSNDRSTSAYKWSFIVPWICASEIVEGEQFEESSISGGNSYIGGTSDQESSVLSHETMIDGDNNEAGDSTSSESTSSEEPRRFRMLTDV